MRLVPNAELAEFPDAGHGVIFQRAQDLAARMLAHFAKHDQPSRQTRERATSAR